LRRGQECGQGAAERAAAAALSQGIDIGIDLRRIKTGLCDVQPPKRSTKSAHRRTLGELPLPSSNPGLDVEDWIRWHLVTAAATGSASASAATTRAFARLVAVPAKHRTIAARLERHSCRLAATRTNHRCSCGRSRTVAGAPLVLLLCLTASLATLRGRITTFLEERLISSGEGEVLPAIAARK